MELRLENIKENPAVLLRKVGYIFQSREKEKMSFIRQLARSGYPRFHAYVYLEGTTLTISFHLDQKKETYGNGTRHHGEYASEGALQTEVNRVKQRLS